MSYKVLVDDNFHYQDESERYELGVFDSYEKALEAAKQIVDKYLLSELTQEKSSSQLYDDYIGFGEDPFIVAVPPSEKVEPRFSAWDYAKTKCEELCGTKVLFK